MRCVHLADLRWGWPVGETVAVLGVDTNPEIALVSVDSTMVCQAGSRAVGYSRAIIVVLEIVEVGVVGVCLAGDTGASAHEAFWAFRIDVRLAWCPVHLGATQVRRCAEAP